MGICYFSTKQAVFKWSMSKCLLAWNWDNVSEWSIMFTSRLLLNYSYRNPTKLFIIIISDLNCSLQNIAEKLLI
jgi:hypothetical protein